jgi:thioesterase domain-containing protein
MLSSSQRAQLAARLRQTRSRAPVREATGPVVPLTDGGEHPPLYLFHAVGGTVYGYAHLAHAVSDSYQVFGVEAAGIRPATTPSTSLSEMAGRYASLLRHERPTGPYTVGGWSMGGIIAFEVARLLSADQEKVQLLLIDTPSRPYLSPPPDGDDTTPFVLDVSRQLGIDMATLQGDSGHERLDDLARRLAPDGGDDQSVREDLARRELVFRAHWNSLRGYRPEGTVAGSALIVCARTSPDSSPAWSKAITGDVQAKHVDCDHYTCLLPPAARQIAYWFTHI